MHRVVVAVEEPPLRQGLARFLAGAGALVEAVEPGVEAVQRLDGCDLVIASVGSPLLTEAHRRRLAVPVVLVADRESIGLAVEAMRGGAANFLARPFDLGELEEAVQEALEPAFALGTGLWSTPVAMAWAESGSGLELPGDSSAMIALRQAIAETAAQDGAVLVCGEPGSGTVAVGRSIHAAGRREGRALVAVSGREARSGPPGWIEAAIAREAAVLVEEVDELPLAAQAWLARAIERPGEPGRGGRAQVIATSHRDLEVLAAAGSFDGRLLKVFAARTVKVPALRERGSDVLLLAGRALRRTGGSRALDADAGACFLRYRWPGNVKELEEVVTTAVARASGPVIGLAELPPRVRAAFARTAGATAGRPRRRGGASPAIALPEDGLDLRETLDTIERRLIHQALDRTGGNRNRAAALLRLNRTTLVEKLKRRGG